MNRSAARLVSVIENRQRVRSHAAVRPPGDGLPPRMRTQILALEVAQFVQPGEVRGVVTRAAFETDDLHPRLRQFGSEYSACRADADDDDVCFLSGHESGPRLCWTCRAEAFGGGGLQADH